jgi:hypothetical protein
MTSLYINANFKIYTLIQQRQLNYQISNAFTHPRQKLDFGGNKPVEYFPVDEK